MKPFEDKFSVLKIHQQNLISSQNNIKTSLKTRSKQIQGTTKVNNPTRKSTFNIFPHVKEEITEDLVLPAVESQDVTPKSCLVVDILQLANSYSSNHKIESKTLRRSSNFSGELKYYLVFVVAVQHRDHEWEVASSPPYPALFQSFRNILSTDWFYGFLVCSLLLSSRLIAQR